ncbi:MAG TPA: hypothetical protein PLU39_08990 [Armatimonadota bacterium]|jgi:uncharacterized Zn finger protein|nr:hypothetical protein [Armatimonadota bacterium]HOJ22191.1 hypothetical protein [Armatimonadota bacterium]HOM81474.1 hypothetical protein [Armatimonadota bacterium]HOQ30001.1 hypothetical protein [Armatimonadota bacterium]HPO72768.1 hypothetical protein [Armatimonadota bacterium]
MRECPQCRKGHWHEVVEYGTSCHGVVVVGRPPVRCTECGMRNPPVEETDRYYQCETCGYVERQPGEREL